MVAYLYVNRDGSEIISNTLTYNKTGKEVIKNEDDTFSEVTYWLRDGKLSATAYVNGYGELLPEYPADSVGYIKSSVFGEDNDNGNGENDERKSFTFQDVTSRFTPSLEKLTEWNTYSMTKFFYLPKGTIEKLIGKKLTFDDKPYKITESILE